MKPQIISEPSPAPSAASKNVPGPSFQPPARIVKKIFIHCTASDNENLKGEGLVDEVRRWHLARGFKDVGYHFLIDKAGTLLPARPLEQVPAAQEGYNAGSIAICVHGLANFTQASLDALHAFCLDIDEAYRARGAPVTFHGHTEVSPKTCPVFDYRKVLDLDKDGSML